ncbi:MAG: hypothetical protein QOI91_1460 [Solirubrobacteraceae bacterium]|jgi:hypothetical protein|nr:hypothetical protein [Solirubrobacteraceae bacterium]
MTTATAPAPLFTLPSTESAPELAPHRPAASPGGARVQHLSHGRLTLGEVVSGAWAAIGAGAPAACPVCDGMLRRRAGGQIAADCTRCGSELA